MTGGPRAAENGQDIELLEGERVGLEQLVVLALDDVGGAEDGDERDDRRRGKGAGLLDLGFDEGAGAHAHLYNM